MGIAAIREAFTDQAGATATVTAARHRYLQDGNNSQVLEFEGQWADGSPFAIASDPIDPKGDLVAGARALADKLKAGRAKA